MSFPRHPKGTQIDRMLWEFRQAKEIVAATKVHSSVVVNRALLLGLKFFRITEEERRLVEDHRRKKGLINTPARNRLPAPLGP